MPRYSLNIGRCDPLLKNPFDPAQIMIVLALCLSYLSLTISLLFLPTRNSPVSAVSPIPAHILKFSTESLSLVARNGPPPVYKCLGVSSTTEPSLVC